MASNKGNVSLNDLFVEIQAEVDSFVKETSDWEPVALEAGDQVIGSVDDNAEVKALFHLRNRAETKRQKYGMYFSLMGEFPQGVSEEAAVVVAQRAAIFDQLFWSLLRRVSGATGPALAIRAGWLVAIPSEAAIAAATGRPGKLADPSPVKELVN